jgi:putative pyruvate formate lyase activating enzyme
MRHSPPKNLKRYQRIAQRELPAQFNICKSIAVEFEKTDPTSLLWELHEQAMREHRRQRETSEPHEVKPAETSLLDLKIELAQRNLQHCTLCERGCRVNRLKKEIGYCGIEAVSRYAAEFLHTGEEPELVPSHTIFFTGCNFQCVYCQNWDISTSPRFGDPLLPEKMAELITRRHLLGGKNVNFVTPTPHLPNILKTLKHLQINLPVIWNCNMYYSDETAKLLAGIADVYLGDFRYGDDRCAAELSDAPSYTEVVKRNFNAAYIEGEILMRHLVLPGHIECCTKNITQWVRQHTPHIRFNLMFQYRLEYKAHHYPRINRYLSQEEKQQAIKYASELEDLLI